MCFQLSNKGFLVHSYIVQVIGFLEWNSKLFFVSLLQCFYAPFMKVRCTHKCAYSTNNSIVYKISYIIAPAVLVNDAFFAWILQFDKKITT